MIWKILFHLIGAVQFCYGCYYDHTYVQPPSSSTNVTPYGGKLKYLTFLNAMLQTIYFTVALFNDLFGTNESSPAQKPWIRRVKDILFSTLAFPISIFVCVTFWGIYAVDRELILPRRLDPYFPLWLNHVMHTNILIFSMIELVTTFRMYPKRKLGLTILSIFMLCYTVWIHVIYYETGHWVYPILNVLNWPVRIIFYVFNLGCVCTMYSVGERLNELVWSNEVQETVRSGKKRAQ